MPQHWVSCVVPHEHKHIGNQPNTPAVRLRLQQLHSPPQVANALLTRHQLAQVHVLLVAQVRLQLHSFAQCLHSLLTRGGTSKLS